MSLEQDQDPVQKFSIIEDNGNTTMEVGTADEPRRIHSQYVKEEHHLTEIDD